MGNKKAHIHEINESTFMKVRIPILEATSVQ